MNDSQRYEKLLEARRLIREVEFSYKEGDEYRLLLYKFVVESFSNIGSLSGLIDDLKGSHDRYTKANTEADEQFLKIIGVIK